VERDEGYAYKAAIDECDEAPVSCKILTHLRRGKIVL